MPRKYIAESAILRYFRERGMQGDGKGGRLDYLGAIQAIPRGLRTMYAHAYQSLVWNHVASARLKLGNQVLPGDLVLVTATKAAPKEEVDQDGEVVIAPDASAQTVESDFQRARAITEEEAKSGKFQMADIVLSTPGWDIEYPAIDELMKVYKDVMAKDSLDPMDMKRSVRDWSLSGSYRKVLSRFVDDECSYEVRRCKLGEQVVGTDVEAMEQAAAAAGEKRKRSAIDADATAETAPETTEEESVVVLRMRLGTSCYATMALRELMKGGVKAYKPEFGR